MYNHDKVYMYNHDKVYMYNHDCTRCTSTLLYMYNVMYMCTSIHMIVPSLYMYNVMYIYMYMYIIM